MNQQNITQYSSNPLDAVRGMLKNLITDNDAFVRSRGEEYFGRFTGGQNPRATLLTCSDSRIHEHAFDFTPDSDIFMVRNIGNQIHTALGSIHYGINHLNTPLLLILGHTGCGAIEAASGDYAGLEPQVREELETIRISGGGTNLAGVKENVNNQVREAMQIFRGRVESGVLAVLGAVYDFRNEMGNGFGRLNIININGETDPDAIGASPLLYDA